MGLQRAWHNWADAHVCASVCTHTQHTHTHTHRGISTVGEKRRVRTLENKLQSPVYTISYGIRVSSSLGLDSFAYFLNECGTRSQHVFIQTFCQTFSLDCQHVCRSQGNSGQCLFCHSYHKNRHPIHGFPNNTCFPLPTTILTCNQSRFENITIKDVQYAFWHWCFETLEIYSSSYKTEAHLWKRDGIHTNLCLIAPTGANRTKRQKSSCKSQRRTGSMGS